MLRTSFLKWDRPFLSRLFNLSLPIMLQSLFGVLGSAITTLMVGQLGDIPLAAAGLSNQLFFILSLVQFGIASGCSIFTAQFWGKQDTTSILKVLGVGSVMGFTAGGCFAVIALFIPRYFLQIFTTDQQVVQLGMTMLRITGISYLFTPVIINYSLILRTTGNVRLPMLVSTSGVILNIILGFILVFGKLGLPAMGAQGAAYANLIARVCECLLLAWMIYLYKTPLAASPRKIFSFSRQFLKRILHKVTPVMFNELLWSLGISAYAAIYAHISTESIAAISIKDSLENLIFVPFLGITHACAIMVGNTIGSGKKEKSYGFVSQSVKVALIMAVVLGTGIGIFRHFIISLYKITDLTRFFAQNLLLIQAIMLWVRTLNLVFFIGMMRSGGDTRFAYWMDVGAMWLVGVPMALLGAFVFKLPVYGVYLMVMVEEVLKLIISICRYRSRRWIHDLVTA